MSKKEFKEALKGVTTPEARLEQKRKHVNNTDAAIKKDFQELVKSIMSIVGTDYRSSQKFFEYSNRIGIHLHNHSRRIIELEEEVERLNTIITNNNAVKSISSEEQRANLERLESISDAIFRDLARDVFTP